MPKKIEFVTIAIGDSDEEGLTKYKKIIESQAEYITEHYSRDDAEAANYGWASSDEEICTKIYLSPPVYLTSYISPSGDVVHTIEYEGIK